MDFRFSAVFLKALEFSRDEALRTGWHNICPDHIMLGILRQADNRACRILASLGVDSALFKESIDEALFSPEQIPWEEREDINFRSSAASVLREAALESGRCQANFVGPEHFLLALCREDGSFCREWLAGRGIDHAGVLAALGADGYASCTEKAAAPDLAAMAAAIEKRLKDGFVTDTVFTS